MKFEDVVGSLGSRREALRRLCGFLGLDPGGFADGFLKDLPVIQATQPPAPARWRRRRDALLPLLSDPRLREAAAACGYGE